ncbi:MAG TPA: tetratricopeptide repeat protein [Capsulimonadaceae bacterium]|jgi:tetratricopeptide (TPR) repeat protein
MSMLGRMFGFGRNINYDQGLRFFDQGLFEEAINSLKKVIADDAPADPLSRRLALFYIAESNSSLGISALQKHSYAAAKDYLKNALDLNPHYADLRLYYGRACHKLGDFAAARDSYSEALRINAKFAKARFYYGLAVYELGDIEAGYKDIQLAVTQEPAFKTDLLEKAVTAHEAADHTGASALFEQVAETDVDDISYHVKLGTDLYRRGMYDQAIEELTKALSLNGNYADIHNHLGVAYNAKNLHDKAKGEFEEALRINGKYVEALTNLGLTLEAMNDDESAKAQFRKVLEIDPGNVVAKERLRS